jgi:hypothetical protein
VSRVGRSGAAALSLTGAFTLLTAVAWTALTSPRVPYNVRELSEGRSPLLTAPLLALLLLSVFGVPAWIAASPLRRGRVPAWRLLPLLVAQGALVWVLLRVAVPMEALHDIVGSPVLRGSREGETAGRFLALFLGAATMLLGAAAAWIAWEERDRRPLARWAAGAAATLPVSYAVVVPLAATDNLTELMRGGGGVLPAAAIALAVLTVGIAGSGISRLLAGRSRAPLATTAICALMLPAGFAWLHLGLEPAVEKYGRTFSALQFLLSQDRAHLAVEAVVRLRYALAFAAGALAAALAQHAAWLGTRPTPQGGSGRSPARAQPESGFSSTTASAEKE